MELLAILRGFYKQFYFLYAIVSYDQSNSLFYHL